MHEILTAAEMREAERRTVAAGASSFDLMQRAGRAVAETALRMLQTRATQGEEPHNVKVTVLCGPGNKGGDGFITATELAARGYGVDVALLGDRADLTGDADRAAALWHGPIAAIDTSGAVAHALVNAPPALIIDALFGIGLNRPVTGPAATLIASLPRMPILAIDIASGIACDSGAVLGIAVHATRTVTFGRLKPGHLLMPGRHYGGAVEIADIGIDPTVIAGLDCQTVHNVPGIWCEDFPVPDATAHKYTRGWAAVVCGPALSTGAARLAAMTALRAGAGIVTLHAAPDAATVLAHHLTAIMIRGTSSIEAFTEGLTDARLRSIVIGPALGLDDDAQLKLAAVLARNVGVVIDADALTLLARHRAVLWPLLTSRTAATVLTPHAGEFNRLFGVAPDQQQADRLSAACIAAHTSGATIILKGADTIVAAPDGRVAINDNAPADLATAGTGDVLAGLAGGLLAQGVAEFQAAAMAVWMHGAAARHVGPGLIAEDLPHAMPRIVDALRGIKRNRDASPNLRHSPIHSNF
jgi:ADP-dependent NAD(P)H-hydrate dehydratase / NAD(P)H-hydrate epimerase